MINQISSNMVQLVMQAASSADSRCHIFIYGIKHRIQTVNPEFVKERIDNCQFKDLTNNEYVKTKVVDKRFVDVWQEGR